MALSALLAMIMAESIQVSFSNGARASWRWDSPELRPPLRVCAKITWHFGISYSRHLRPLLNREILNLDRLILRFLSIVRGQILCKYERQFYQVILAQTLRSGLGCLDPEARQRLAYGEG